jgi:glycosyltransferase involved in cell wall biosynthesis
VPRRLRILVFNQYYWPGVEATAHLLDQLCVDLARDFDVTVVTGRLDRDDARPGAAERNGVRVIRVPSTAYDRSNLGRRALNYVSYMALALGEGVRARRPDIVLCMTDPPLVADVALAVARRFRAPLVVISQDVFPEVAVELGRLQSRTLVGLLRVLIRLYLRRADRVVAIGETMRERLVEKGAPAERVRVIPNWVDTDALVPAPRPNAWARERRLDDKFVVMHSGNVGHAQNLDALVRAATFLRDLDRLRIVVVGTGARHQELVALARRLEVLETVRFLPYQPRERLSESLSTAHVHVVGLARGLAGYVVPSRLYGVLAVGRPVVVAADAESETARIVERVGCGVVVPPGRPELLAATIRQAHDGDLDLDELGRRGREWVTREAAASVAFARYRDVVHELVGERP